MDDDSGVAPFQETSKWMKWPNSKISVCVTGEVPRHRETCRLHGRIQSQRCFSAHGFSDAVCAANDGVVRPVSMPVFAREPWRGPHQRALKLELEPSLVRSDLTSSHFPKTCQQIPPWGSWSNIYIFASIAWLGIPSTPIVVQLCNFQSNSLLAAAAWPWRDMHSHSHTKGCVSAAYTNPTLLGCKTVDTQSEARGTHIVDKQ